jgi:FkbM family methyltransferase
VRILCCVPTRDRYAELAGCIQSIALQTRPPDHLTVYDDSTERQDLRSHPVLKHLLRVLEARGIAWNVVFTPGLGQHVAHQLANTTPGYDAVWRLDDDQVAESNVLESLSAYLENPGIAAVGGAVYEPGNPAVGPTSGELVHLFDLPHVQWCPDRGTSDVDHLYSSFLYRTGLASYKLNMSPVAFREETIFSHRLKRLGHRLVVNTHLRTYHLRAETGGCRGDRTWAYAWDQAEFLKLAEQEWSLKLISTGGGFGDCFALKSLLPEFFERYEQVIVGSCYPQVFEGEERVTAVRFEATRDVKNDDIYSYMAEHNWKGTLIEALRELHLGTKPVKLLRPDLEIVEPSVYDEIFRRNCYGVIPEELKDKTVLDIGANVGMFTLYALELGAKHVIAVEAQGTIFSQGLCPRVVGLPVTPLHLAAYSEDGLELRIENRHLGSKLGEAGERVRSITLESLLDEYPEVTALKLDVEGAEFDVLLTTPSHVLRQLDVIYMEVHGRFNPNPAWRTVAVLEERLRFAGFTRAHDEQGPNEVDIRVQKWLKNEKSEEKRA